MKQEEFKNRYLVKVLSSVLIAVLNIVIQLLLPRIFSIEEYGYYSYNLNVFTSIVVIANLATSNALVSKFSKRNDDIGLVFFYLKFFAVASLLVNAIVLILYPFDLFNDVFAGQTFFIVLLGLETSLLNKLLTDSISMYDASAISKFPAVMQITLKVLVSCSVIVGYCLGRYNLSVFYLTQIIITCVVIAILLYVLVQDNIHRYNNVKQFETLEYVREFWCYCRPLILATATSQIVIIVMNWALMRWSGVTNQAMFGIAWQFNYLVSYVFSPYAELSKREFAILSGDKDSLRYRFEQSLRLIVWLTSYFAIFIAFMSDSIVPILFGDKYVQATLITGIIMFYTVFQAMGQLSGSYLMAVEETKANAAISIMGQVVTVVFIFLFQVPNFFWPETLGVIGIALNYLLGNIITVTVSVLYISRTLKSHFIKIIIASIIPMAVASLLVLIFKSFVEIVIPDTSLLNLAVRIVFVGVIYTFLLGLVVWIKPDLIGVSKEYLRTLVQEKLSILFERV